MVLPHSQAPFQLRLLSQVLLRRLLPHYECDKEFDVEVGLLVFGLYLCLILLSHLLICPVREIL
jgi:hypothetical protein